MLTKRTEGDAASRGARRTRTVRLVLAVAGFCVAAALVGAGSIGADQRGGSRGSDTALVAVAILVGACAAAFVVLVTLRTRRPAAVAVAPARGAGAMLMKPLLTPVMATLLLLLLYSLVVGPCIKDDGRPDRTVEDTSPSTTAPPPNGASAAADRPDWPLVAGIVLGASGLLLALAAAAARRRPDAPPEEPTLADEIAQSLVDLDGLDHDPDHRRVVIRTYARMERALGRTGIPREPSETAQEFLRRALAHLGAGAAPAARLTDLFELARFSTHPVDRAMRADAAAALRTVRDDIASGDARASSVAGTGP